MIPTHNSPTLAAWGLYLLAGDGEQGQKVFITAKDGQQARGICGKHAVEMMLASPSLFEECTLNKSRLQITHEASRSIMVPLSSANIQTQKASEGINGCVLVDETHVVDRAHMNRITRAGISRSEPFHIEVSTAGNDPDSYGKERYDYAQRVLRGEHVDHQLFALCHEAPQDLADGDLDADPVKYGKGANPSWGRTIGKEEYLADYNESKASISTLADFKMYRLNIWQKTTNPWLRTSDWQACQHEYTEADLYGKPCGAGLDMSRTEDMTAFCLVFPEESASEEDKPVKGLWWYWLPEAAIERHGHEVAYAQWAADGWLTVIPGPVVDFAFVERDVARILGKFDVRCLAFDQKYANEFVQRLSEQHGWRGEPYVFPQTIMGFAGPTAKFERLVIAGKLQHRGNPISTWQAGHTEVWRDANDNIRPVKPKQANIKKIDGIVAGIMALDASDQMPASSPYQTRGFLTL
jgi:phage terminase large subunit-like protein